MSAPTATARKRNGARAGGMSGMAFLLKQASYQLEQEAHDDESDPQSPQAIIKTRPPLHRLVSPFQQEGRVPFAADSRREPKQEKQDSPAYVEGQADGVDDGFCQ